MILPVAFAIPVGLCLGSFCATAALRLARGEQALVGRSACDGCGAQLGWRETLPVVSFLVRRGKCARCGHRIDPVHLAGELCGAAILACAVSLSSPFRSLGVALLGLVLMTSALVDLKTRRLPDALTLTVGALCAAMAANASPQRLAIGAAAAVIAFAVLETLRRAYAAARGTPGLGFGDVKLIAALGLWLGVLTPWAVCLASLVGLAVVLWKRPARDERIPFGPALAAGAWLVGFAAEAHLWPMS
jgi:leader peptidase (prepilin peptidase)/N-methyltransferase